jgi:hypothetical protein
MGQQLEALLASARDIPRLVETNPAQSAALAATLGGLIFLVPEVKPAMKELTNAMRRPGPSDPMIYAGDVSTTYSQPSKPTSEDVAALDFAGFDADAFAAIDTSMAAFDASFDTAAAGGGDAGGGGDGGSG